MKSNLRILLKNHIVRKISGQDHLGVRNTRQAEKRKKKQDASHIK
jgi:hypothetical protein